MSLIFVKTDYYWTAIGRELAVSLQYLQTVANNSGRLIDPVHCNKTSVHRTGTSDFDPISDTFPAEEVIAVSDDGVDENPFTDGTNKLFKYE